MLFISAPTCWCRSWTLQYKWNIEYFISAVLGPSRTCSFRSGDAELARCRERLGKNFLWKYLNIFAVITVLRYSGTREKSCGGPQITKCICYFITLLV